MRPSLFIILSIACGMLAACADPKPQGLPDSKLNCDEALPKIGLLASRIKHLDSLKNFVEINYSSSQKSNKSETQIYDKVQLNYCFQGTLIQSELIDDLSQADIKKAKEGNLLDKLNLLLLSPYAVSNRNELAQIYVLARRRYDLFGINDKAFYDLAEIAAEKINDSTAFESKRDYGEKGYINSFNHITAQSFITSIYSEELADFIADVHERDNMPELVSGLFTEEQLKDLNNNPVDNYIDMINNEIGQELGKQLRAKYGINEDFQWSLEVLTSYLNDLQSYYQYSYKIKMEPFRKEEAVVRSFLKKLNKLSDYKVNT